MARTKVEWTARPGTIPQSWNPVTGCNPVSPGCQNCYAARMAKRLKAMGQPKYADGFRVTCHDNRGPDGYYKPEDPLRWRKPRTCFVCSMSDLFHVAVPGEFIKHVFWILAHALPVHTFILLTKRPERMESWANENLEPTAWPPNVWAGVTVEHPNYLWRLDHLRQVPAAVRFVSFEPLLGSLDDWRASRLREYLDGIDWAIVGAETGPHKRPMSDGAAGLILGAAKRSRTARFFKRGNDGSRLFFGETYEEWPR